MTRRKRTSGQPPTPTPAAGLAVRDDELAELIAAWLPRQRWFAGGEDEAAGVTITARRPLPALAAAAAELVVVSDPASGPQRFYQVVIGWRATVPPHLEHTLIGTASGLFCYDALLDDTVTGPLLRAALTGVPLGPITATAPPTPAAPGDGTGAGGPEDRPHGLPLTVEQSNTSVVFDNEVIIKFFRGIEPGVNPDAEISRALAGRDYTTGFRGELRTDIAGSPTTLALATDFLPNSADAWSAATASVRDLLAEGDLHADEVGGDFATEAFRLGAVIARMHRDLAEAFGSRGADPTDTAHLLAGIRTRAASLAVRLPEIHHLLPSIERAVADLADRLADERRPVQRIHGDLHLGQVLRTVAGWVVIDFEGEPARPIADRRRFASPLRDVAGMMRSFDYAARQPLYASTVNSQRAYRSDEWLAHNRTAFLDGYAEVDGTDPRSRPAGLAVFELAKALYEVDYEARHRPAWVKIPLEALRALVTPTGG